jgi:diguanylate cyclase (GGDEF)-like protein/PAS domain S-box-containing protein
MTDIWRSAPTLDAVLAPAARLLTNLPEPALLLASTAPGSWRVAWVNPAFESITGFSADEAVGRAPGLLLGPLTEPGLYDRAGDELHSQGTFHGAVVLHARDGRPLWVDVDGALLDEPTEEGAQVAWVRAKVHLEDTDAFRVLLENLNDVVLVLDGDGVIRYMSPSVRHIGSYRPVDFVGRTIFDLLDPAHHGEHLAFFAEVVANPGLHGPAMVTVWGPTGDRHEVEIVLNNRLDDPGVHGIVLTARDVQARVEAEAELDARERLLAGELGVLEEMAGSGSLLPVLRRLADLVESALPGARCSIGTTDPDGVVRHRAAPTLAPALLALLDAEPADGPLGLQVRNGSGQVIVEDVGTDPAWGELGAAAREQDLAACWWFTVRGLDDHELVGLVTLFHEEGRGPTPAELHVLDRVRHLAALALDRSRFERRLEHQALHDGLTGLPNRSLLLDRVAQALQSAGRYGTTTAVLLLDLDRFNLVNDSYGHVVGDELLRQVGDRLTGAVAAGDTVGRFGGDEFLVVLEDVNGDAGAVVAAERLLAVLSEPFVVGGVRRVANASIGVALAGPGRMIGPDALVRNADAAMYRAKDQGRGRIALFEDTLHAEAVRRYEIEHGLRSALDDDQLVLLYQPCVRLADGRVTGVEALLRWDRPGHGRIGADELIPVAEETGLIVPIGRWVLQRACAQAVAWDAEPTTAGLTMAVNLSARQLGDPGLVATVAEVLAQTGLAPERLCLEVTESALAGDTDTAVAALTSLKLLGVQLAIDDFGTGYATLDYVRRFSMADELKIDRSFVAGVADFHSPDAAIVSAAIVLADALGFEVVAEGVETAEQLAVLRRLGCGRAQGYYFGKPTEAVPPVH